MMLHYTPTRSVQIRIPEALRIPSYLPERLEILLPSFRVEGAGTVAEVATEWMRVRNRL